MRLRSLFAVATVTLMALAPAAWAEPKADALATVAKATATVEDLYQDEHFPDYWQPSLARARAVLIVPSFYKAGFLVGGAYGNGVLLVRNDKGEFSAPAFYRMAAGSFGLQIGAEEREIMFMIMTDTGLKAIMEDRFKVGAGLNLSIATFGGGAEASTTTGKAVDIVAFSHAAGAYGGGVIEGAGIEVRKDWNHSLYGANATPKGIVFDRRYQLPEAKDLLAALDRASQPPHNGGAQAQGAEQPANAPGQAGTPVASDPAANSAPGASSAPVGSVETQSLDAPSSASSGGTSSSSSSSSGPVKLVPQTGNTLQ